MEKNIVVASATVVGKKRVAIIRDLRFVMISYEFPYDFSNDARRQHIRIALFGASSF